MLESEGIRTFDLAQSFPEVWLEQYQEILGVIPSSRVLGGCVSQCNIRETTREPDTNLLAVALSGLSLTRI